MVALCRRYLLLPGPSVLLVRTRTENQHQVLGIGGLYLLNEVLNQQFCMFMWELGFVLWRLGIGSECRESDSIKICKA